MEDLLCTSSWRSRCSSDGKGCPLVGETCFCWLSWAAFTCLGPRGQAFAATARATRLSQQKCRLLSYVWISNKKMKTISASECLKCCLGYVYTKVTLFNRNSNWRWATCMVFASSNFIVLLPLCIQGWWACLQLFRTSPTWYLPLGPFPSLTHILGSWQMCHSGLGQLSLPRPLSQGMFASQWGGGGVWKALCFVASLSGWIMAVVSLIHSSERLVSKASPASLLCCMHFLCCHSP